MWQPLVAVLLAACSNQPDDGKRAIFGTQEPAARDGDAPQIA